MLYCVILILVLESGRIGEDPSGIPNNLMPYITCYGGEKRKATCFGMIMLLMMAQGKRLPSCSRRLEGIWSFGKVQVMTGVEAYNLGTGVGYSVFDVVEFC